MVYALALLHSAVFAIYPGDLNRVFKRSGELLMSGSKLVQNNESRCTENKNGKVCLRVQKNFEELQIFNPKGVVSYQATYDSTAKERMVRYFNSISGKLESATKTTVFSDFIKVENYGSDDTVPVSMYRTALPSESSGGQATRCADDPALQSQLKDIYIEANGLVMDEVADKDGYYQLSYGPKLHRSCLAKDDGKEMNINFANALTQGVSCLADLRNPRADAHVLELMNNVVDKKAKFRCDFSRPNSAQATAKEDPEFPGIRYSPVGGSGLALDFKRLVFHEMMHLNGHMHGEGVDYPESCSQCCFPAVYEMKKLACEICVAPEKDFTTLEYQNKLLKLTEVSALPLYSSMAATKFVELQPTNKQSYILLVKALKKVNPALAGAISKEFQKDNLPEFNKAEFREIAKVPTATTNLKNEDLAKILNQYSKGEYEAAAKALKQLGPLPKPGGGSEARAWADANDNVVRTYRDLQAGLAMSIYNRFGEVANKAQTYLAKQTALKKQSEIATMISSYND